MAAQPFFLVGSERSGTTLLRLMLSHHPQIECAPEFEFLVDFLPDEGWPSAEAYREYLATNRIFEPHGFRIDEALDYPELAKSFLAQYCEPSGKPIAGATCHHHFDRLLRIWPEARFVHILRDGRDVARSCVQMGWAGNVWYGAQRWIEAEEIWERMSAVLPKERRFDLTHEELITDPEATLSALCGFLGTEYDSSMLSYHEHSTYEPPNPKLTQQWKRKLAPKELALLEARIGPQLRARGYEPSGVDPLRVGPLHRAALCADDRVTGFLFRMRRYGLANQLKRAAAVCLGWRGLEKNVQLERNRVDNQYLQ